MNNSAIGKSALRRELPDKLTGRAKYTSDIKLPGMLQGKILRSPHAHARVLSVDTSKAMQLPGVRSVLTPFDIPEGRVAPDLPILDKVARFIGDEVAAVAADNEDIAQEALSLIDVEYEILPFVINPKTAMQADAPAIHAGGNLVGGKPLTLTRGNVSEGFAQADHIFEGTYSTPAHSGAALEPRVTLAAWDGDKLTVWKASRGVHVDRLNIALSLNIPKESVRVIGPHMGAGYGSKDETRLATLCVLLAQRAGNPVKIELTREEEFVGGRKRHATETTVKVGVTNEGTVTAIHATTLMDTGAYLSSGPGVVRRAGQGALYLYKCANVQYDGYLVYTNQPAAGSYRALGAPQGHFALESTMNMAAEALGIDPLEFRLRNHVGLEGQPGERVTPANEIMDTQPVEGGVPFSSNGLHECLEKGAEAFGWQERKQQSSVNTGPVKKGIGMGMFIYRGGPGSKSAARLKLNEDGSVALIAGLMDVGEGSTTVIPQIAAEELGVPHEQVIPFFGDTELTPEAPLTAGSTATFSTGLAAKEAASQLKAKILEVAASNMGVDAGSLSIRDGIIINEADQGQTMSLANVARLTADSPLEVEASIIPGSKDYIVNSFGAHFAEVEVDTDTGHVKVLKYVAAHDSGRILNPTLAINQIEGGVSQMLGFTLTEEMLTDPASGATLNANFLEHKGPTIQEYPPVEVVFADVVDPIGPFGAKAIGEPPSIGVAPAIISAIYDAVGIRLQHLPATPDKILNALSAKESEDKS